MTGHTPLVVDDHAVLRAAASTMFAAERSDVVDEAADGAGLSGRIILGGRTQVLGAPASHRPAS